MGGDDLRASVEDEARRVRIQTYGGYPRRGGWEELVSGWGFGRSVGLGR